MKIKKHTPLAFFVGCQACLIQIIDQCIHGFLPPEGNIGFSCISFFAWATYFMAGCTVKNGVRAFIGFIIGIVASIIIMLLSGTFGALGFFATPLAILIIAWLLFYLDIAPEIFSFIPAAYISAGAYFLSMSYVPNTAYLTMFLTEMIYLTLGLFFGWMTIAFRSWYENKVKE